EPAVLGPTVGSLGSIVIGRGDRRAAHLELAHARTVPGDEALGSAGADLDERNRWALLRTLVVHRVAREAELLARAPGRRPDRAHLGHAPAVHDLEAVALAERLEHRPRRRRAADRHRPHRRQV